MEEEWMRDRALLRDLLRHYPQAAPQELARLTGRSVSWVKKWRQRLEAADQEDPSVVCSRSRAHHDPYFRWDRRVMGADCGTASGSTRALAARAWPTRLAVLPSARPAVTSRPPPAPPLQSHHLEDPAHNGLPGAPF